MAGLINGWGSDGLEGLAAPYSENAEQAVLAGLLLDNSAWDRTSELLKEADFYRAEHRLIFAACSSLMSAGKPADVITVFEHLTMLGKADESGGLVYLNALAQSVASAINVRHHAGIVRDKAALRQLIAAADEIRVAACAPGATPSSVHGCARSALAKTSDSLAENAGPRWVSQVKNWVPAEDLRTRTIEVEFAVGGWIQRGAVGALVAAGGTGKTTLLLVLGICIALNRPFFGCKVTPGSFVLLSGDDSQVDLNGALTLVVQAMKLSTEEAATVAAKFRVVSLQQSDGTKTFTASVYGDPLATGLDMLILDAVKDISDLGLC